MAAQTLRLDPLVQDSKRAINQCAHAGVAKVIEFPSLEQAPKLLHAQPGILHDSTLRECVDRIVTRNRNEVRAIAHHDVLALPQNLESGFLQRPELPGDD